MIYLFIDDHSIRVLSLKKTIFGQQETAFFHKKYETQLLKNGQIINSDLLASAIKESLNLATPIPITEKEVCLILPQEVFSFLRFEIPVDVASSAISAFIKDKARAKIPINLDEAISDSFIVESDKQKVVNFYAIKIEDFEKFKQALSLTDLKIENLIPDTLAYFKLFEKTLRQDKKEIIFYVSYEKNSISGYLFDSYGQLESKKWLADVNNDKVEEVLREKAREFTQQNLRLNRIILSGSSSEKIRQDTFTKSVGVWTNPLKRIAADFYKHYLKLLIISDNRLFPLLDLDVCFGAFIFNTENKSFSLLKKAFSISKSKKISSIHSFSLPVKEIIIFASSFFLSFLFFTVIFNSKPQFNLPFPSSNPTPTFSPTPTLTPTPAFKKEELKIKVLNGSGVRGKAAEVKEILKNAQYGEILTDNADNFDYQITEINIKKNKMSVIPLIKNDLKNYVSSPKIGQLSEKEASDIVIIIGKDFK